MRPRWDLVRVAPEIVERLSQQPEHVVLAGIESHDDGTLELVFRTPAESPPFSPNPELIGDNRLRRRLRRLLKDAKPFDPDAFKPLEGAEELPEALGACMPCAMEEQLKRVTAEAVQLREACEAIRDLWRNPVPAQRQVVAFQEAVRIACAALEYP